MNNLVDFYQLKPGDRIVTPLFQTQVSKHHIIYAGRDEVGRDWFIENRVFHGVRLFGLEEFQTIAKAISRIERFPGNEFQREMAVRRAMNLIGKSYNLVSYNCEHFANEVQCGVAKSDQVATAALCLAGFALFKLFTTAEK